MKFLKSNLKYIVTIVCFLAFIFGFAIGGILSVDREFSDMENRTLQQFPEFSSEKLKDGDFTSDIETYMSDQIFLKDELVSLKVSADRLLLKNYQNGVYFGKDGYYLQDYQENKALVEKNVSCLNSFADSLDDDVQVSFLLVPNAVSVLSGKLPAVTQTDDQLDTIEYVKEDLSDKITFCCPFEELSQADKDGIQVFYRTDHHWTADGAFYGFTALMESMGESVPQVDHAVEELADFYGTLYSKAPYGGAQPDTVRLLTNPDNDITVTYVDGANDKSLTAEGEVVGDDLVTHSLFDDSHKTVKDKYAAFLGGNFKEIKIETQGESDEKVLILKDSYANTVMPYFADKYQHITMIDLRYYHMEELTVSEYVKENDIDKVIFLYNVDFLNSDNNFVWLD